MTTVGAGTRVRRLLIPLSGRDMARFAPALLLLPAALLFASLAGSFVILGRYSLSAGRGVTPEGYTLAQYDVLLTGYNRLAATNSLVIAAWVTGLAIIISYPLALHLIRSRRRGLWIALLLIPVLLDVVIRSYGWVMLLGPSGPIREFIEKMGFQSPDLLFNKTAIVIALLNELLPFMVIPIFISLTSIDRSVLEAAALLGASRLRVFWSILLPLSGPGLIAGAVLVFAIAYSALAVPLFLGGARVATVALVIKNQMVELLNFPFGAAMAVVIGIGMVVAILAVQRVLIRVFFPHYAA